MIASVHIGVPGAGKNQQVCRRPLLFHTDEYLELRLWGQWWVQILALPLTLGEIIWTFWNPVPSAIKQMITISVEGILQGEAYWARQFSADSRMPRFRGKRTVTNAQI